MDSQTLRRLADQYLKPFFSGASLEEDEDISTAREGCVAFKDPCTLAFKLNKSDLFRLKLRRSQPFFLSSGEGSLEKKIVEAFIEILQASETVIGSDLEHDVLSNLQRKIVAKSISEANQEQAILRGIDQLEAWANRLYEGRPVVAALGFSTENMPNGVTLMDIAADDFSAVLSNGHDTILTFDCSGIFITHESLSMPGATLNFAPYRQLQIASWATGNRVALALNRLGEILVLKNQKLIFARRAGRWHFLTQDAIFTQMQKPQNESIRKAVYESCLDASFARTGACVGVVTSQYRNTWGRIVPKEKDRLELLTSVKTKTLAKMIGDKPFQELDRRIRLEILAIDGATLINHEGKILAAGAILKIEGGSDSGGRLAAAKALGCYGLGIKVSADGGIKGFVGTDNKLVFQVM